MISVEHAIVKTRRGLTISAILRWALTLSAVIAVLAEPMLSAYGSAPLAALFIIGTIWIVLSFRSIRGTRISADSAGLIAAGQYELAERKISEVLDAFSIFRMVKLANLHQLAVLRRAQSRWQDAAALCKALLMQRTVLDSGLDRSSRLILAESLLELGDFRGAQEHLSRLYTQRLTLNEALSLLAVQTDYEAKVGDWVGMMTNVMSKVEMAELLPPTPSCRTQALLALAAKRIGREDWSGWLRRRVELLSDVGALCAARPMLSELWDN